MITFITLIHITTILFLVVAVLLQSGKGAEISATFGGSSQTVFGSSGGQNFFQKLTYTLAAIFMATSLALHFLPSKLTKSVVLDGPSAPAPAQATTPATAPAAPAASAAPAAPVNEAEPKK